MSIRTPSTNPAALQPPDTTGLVLYRFKGCTNALVARFHDQARMGPFDGPCLGVIGVDELGAVLLVDSPVRRARPRDVEDAAERLRGILSGAGEGGEHAWPFGGLEDCADGTRLAVGQMKLDADDLGRLACAMRDQAESVDAPSWPVRFVPEAITIRGEPERDRLQED